MNNFRKTPLTKEEHLKLASDLRKAQEILGPWLDRFYKAYSVNGKEVAELKHALRLLSSKICCTQDSHFYKINSFDDHNSPYYGSGKVAWI